MKSINDIINESKNNFPTKETINKLIEEVGFDNSSVTKETAKRMFYNIFEYIWTSSKTQVDFDKLMEGLKGAVNDWETDAKNRFNR